MKTKERQPVTLRLPTVQGSCVGKSTHLFTGFEWNSYFYSTRGRNYSPRACPRGKLLLLRWVGCFSCGSRPVELHLATGQGYTEVLFCGSDRMSIKSFQGHVSTWVPINDCGWTNFFLSGKQVSLTVFENLNLETCL